MRMSMLTTFDSLLHAGIMLVAMRSLLSIARTLRRDYCPRSDFNEPPHPSTGALR